MGKFYFQGVTRNGKTVSGSVAADNEAEARTKLAQNGLAVLTLSNTPPQKDKNSNVKLFYFKAINTEQKKVHGTIESEDRYSAYRKLRSEYHFNVIYVVPDDLPSGEKQVLKLKGIEPEFIKQYEEEEKLARKHTTKELSRDEKVELIVQLREQQIGEIRKEISEVIKKVELLLEKNAGYIDKAKIREIKERIDLLSRLRQSNSIEHLQHLTREILTKLNSDSFFITSEGMKKPEDFEEKKKEFKSNVGVFQKNFEKSLEKIQVNLGGLNSEFLKEQIIQMKIVPKVGEFLFWTFFMLANILLLFWVFNSIIMLIGVWGDKASFYFHSGMFWYFTGISVLVSLIFSPLIFSKKTFSLISKCAIFSTAIITLFLFSFEFLAIFRWV